MRFSIVLLKRELGDKTNRKAISWGWASCNRSKSLARYSAKYWVISDREEIREWENACNECKNCKLKAGEQVMAPLLSVGFRQPLRAFAHVSVDFGGLIVTIQGRGSRHVQWQFLGELYAYVQSSGIPENNRHWSGTKFRWFSYIRSFRIWETFRINPKSRIKKWTMGVMWIFNPPWRHKRPFKWSTAMSMSMTQRWRQPSLGWKPC